MKKIIVYHGGYGCDTGCCGHWIDYDDGSKELFTFDHPDEGEDFKKWAEKFLTERLGAEHVKDFFNCY